MSIPFKQKQLFRELFDFIATNGAVTEDDLRGTNKLFYPPFSDSVVAKHTGKGNLNVDAFFAFIVDGRSETNAAWEEIVWGYATNFAKKHVLNNSSTMDLKPLRAAIDPSVRPVAPEPELTNLWKQHCGSAQGTAEGLIDLFKGLVKGGKMQIGVVLQAMLPKGRKNAAGLNPPGSAPSSPRRRASSTASSGGRNSGSGSPTSAKPAGAVPPPPPPRPASPKKADDAAAPSPKKSSEPASPTDLKATQPAVTPGEPASPTKTAADKPATSVAPATSASEAPSPTKPAEAAQAEAVPPPPPPPPPVDPAASHSELRPVSPGREATNSSPAMDGRASPTMMQAPGSPRAGVQMMGDLEASALNNMAGSFAARASFAMPNQPSQHQLPGVGGAQGTRPVPNATVAGGSKAAGDAASVAGASSSASKVAIGVSCRLEADPLPQAVLEVVREIDAQRDVVQRQLDGELKELEASSMVVDALKQRLAALKASSQASSAVEEQRRLEGRMDKFLREVAAQQQHLRGAIAETLQAQAVDAEHARLAIELRASVPEGGAHPTSVFQDTSAVRLQGLVDSMREKEQHVREKEALLKRLRRYEREEQRLAAEIAVRESNASAAAGGPPSAAAAAAVGASPVVASASRVGDASNATPLMQQRPRAAQHEDPRLMVQRSAPGARDGYYYAPSMGGPMAASGGALAPATMQTGMPLPQSAALAAGGRASTASKSATVADASLVGASPYTAGARLTRHSAAQFMAAGSRR